jgi:predicted TIM-barrel fold metal-dependent hydrolase
MLKKSRTKFFNGCVFCDPKTGGFDVGRRDFLAGGAAAALGVFGSLRTAGAQANPRRIDVHHHFSSPGFIKEISTRKTGQIPLERWTPEKSVEDMDKGGVATSIVSISEPGVHFGDNEAARVLARECNEYAAKLKSDHRGRFGSFAIVPMPDVDGSLKEIAYALDTLKLEGICLMTSYQSKYLGDPMFAPLMAELNRRKAVAYVHPVRADCCRALVANVNDPTIELPQDTARTILSVVFSGNARRYPDIRFIFSHAGGTLPLLIHRVEGWANNRKDLAAERFPDGVRAEFRRFYYDTASSDYPWTMMPLTRLVETTQIVFGTDFPFRSAAVTAKGLAEYGFSAADLAAIDRGNAVKLLPSLS